MTAVAEIPTTESHDHSDHGHDHPSDATYLKVAGVLGMLTALEVSTYWWPNRLHKVTAVLLIVMMTIKFATVAAYFMHLKFDAKVLRRVFVAGIVLAVCVYVAALSAFVFWDNSGTAKFDNPPHHRVVPPPPTLPPVKTSAPAAH